MYICFVYNIDSSGYYFCLSIIFFVKFCKKKKKKKKEIKIYREYLKICVCFLFLFVFLSSLGQSKVLSTLNVCSKSQPVLLGF